MTLQLCHYPAMEFPRSHAFIPVSYRTHPYPHFTILHDLYWTLFGFASIGKNGVVLVRALWLVPLSRNSCCGFEIHC